MRRRSSYTVSVLYDIFPRNVADALREGRPVEPEKRECVTIFFSDIVGFTQISSELSPEKVRSLALMICTLCVNVCNLVPPFLKRPLSLTNRCRHC